MANPLVTVIVTTYFRNDHLSSALDSVREQDYSNIETIVVDDSGVDHAEAVVSDRPDVKYIGLPENRGANDARAAGIEAAQGKYVQLLDDDDRLLPEKIVRQVELLESSPDVGAAYCGGKMADGLEFLPDEDERGNVLERALKDSLLSCVTSTLLVERELYRSVFPLPDTPGADDTYLKIELARITEFDFVDDALILRHEPSDSRGRSLGAVRGSKQLVYHYSDLYDRFPPQIKLAAMSKGFRREGKFYLHQNPWSLRATLAFLRASFHAPRNRIKYLLWMFASLFGRPGFKLVTERPERRI